MRQLSQLASLPPALLLLLAATSQWSTATADYDFGALPALPTSPAERQVLQKRHAEIEHRLSRQAPVAVRRMSEDPSEKFFPEFWHFDLKQSRPNDESTRESHSQDRTEATIEQVEYSNTSLVYGFLPPLLPHNFGSSSSSPINLARSLFDKRAYQCPAGYHDCSSIGYVHSCCGTGETCRIIRDTGIGPVGCCPAGQDCSGSVSSCDTANGYKSCPHRRNKNGCCAPGFQCDAIGCIKTVGTVTVHTTRVAVTVTTIISTRVVTPTGSTVYITSTYPTKTKVIGPIVQTLSTDTTTIFTTITRGGPPAPPPGGPGLSTVTLGSCPTGFYRCSAFYLGGCCRVGRDCHSTRCPPQYSTSTIQNGVVTVIIASGEGVTTINQGTFTIVTGSNVFTTVTVGNAPTTNPAVAPTGADGPCAVGWARCPVGGGCCPSGYSCAASCIATVSNLPEKVPKASVMNHGALLEHWVGWATGLAAVVGAGMIWL